MTDDLDPEFLDPELPDAELPDAEFPDPAYDVGAEPYDDDVAEAATEPLFAAGQPLALPADVAADTELQRWLAGPAPVLSATEAAELDRLLRAGLAPPER
jgi:hypothetical protein